MNVIIAILDSGIDLTNQLDIDSLLWTRSGETPADSIDNDGNGYIDDVHGWDFFNQDNMPQDTLEHGTLVSGYAAAKGNNAIGFSGVTQKAQLMPVQVISRFNSLTTSFWAEGVTYAFMNGAKVLNNSFTVGAGYPGHAMVESAYVHASNAGCVVVCGAGNSGANNDTGHPIPSTFRYPGAISVCATDKDDVFANGCTGGSSGAFSSNYGATTVDLAAPGCDLWGLFPNNGYSPHHSGTSASSPIVAGAAALLWQQHPTWTNVQIKDRLMVTVDTLLSLSGKCVSGGRLNIGRALDDIPPSPVTFTYERGHHSVKIMWTETGDDTTDGTATVAAIRWSTTTALNTETAFNAATPVPLDLPLAGAGTEHCIVFTDLTANHTYYVGVKLEDGEFNWSGIGSGSVATLGSGNYEVEECPIGNRPAEARSPIRPTDEATLVWALESARPNPTSGTASINYSTKVGGPVRIGIYNVAGRLVRTLVNEIQPAGTHTVVWDGTSTDGSRVRGGVYFYRMVAEGWQSDRRLVVLGQ